MVGVSAYIEKPCPHCGATLEMPTAAPVEIRADRGTVFWCSDWARIDELVESGRLVRHHRSGHGDPYGQATWWTTTPEPNQEGAQHERS